MRDFIANALDLVPTNLTGIECVPGSLLIASLLIACDPSPPSEAGGFAIIAAESGINIETYSGSPEKRHIRETLGQGACVIDYDQDGDLDLFVPNGAKRMSSAEQDVAPWAFYVRDEDGFREAAQELGLAIRAWGIGCAIGDINGDGWDDLFVTTAASPNRLFLNRKGMSFEDATEISGVGAESLSTSAAFGDLDYDGDLDLFVATYLDETRPPRPERCRWRGIDVMCGPRGFPPTADLIYWNDGSGVFREDAVQATGFGLGVVILDVDLDGDQDVYVANDSSPNHLWENSGSGQLVERGYFAGVALSSSGTTQAGMGVDAGDLDNDGLPEIVVTNFSHDVNNVYHSDEPGEFMDWSHRVGMAEASVNRLGWSVLMEDFDLDGDVDVFVVNGHVFPEVGDHPTGTQYEQPMQLLINDGSGRLSAATTLGPDFEQPISGRGAALGDWDDDGDLDVVVTRDGDVPLFLRNDIPSPDAHWAQVSLRGRSGNPHAIGARVELIAAGRAQVRQIRANRGYLSASNPVAHFGLGPATRVDQLTVVWPWGESQILTDLEVNRKLEVTADE